MSVYVGNIQVAAVLFPMLSALLSLPYAIWQYRRFGSISGWKTILVFSFIFYLMCAYFMVILPLPADRTAVVASAAAPQLEPFHFWPEMARSLARVDVADPATWIAFLRSPGVYTTLFNVLLTTPLGVYARYLFRARWWQALAAGFALSLFFEVSQVTGLFGIYLHPYRLFDVDDLMTNSFGALLGFWLSFPLCLFLPDLDKVEDLATERGATHTTFTRRLVAFIVDMAATACVYAVIAWVVGGLGDAVSRVVAAMGATGVTFMLVPIATRGQTAGQALIGLRVVRPDGSSARWYSYIARYALLYWVFLLGPALLAALFPSATSFASLAGDEASMGSEGIMVVVASVYGVWIASIAFRAVASAFGRPFVMLNGIMSRTRVMSVAQADRLRAARNEASLSEELHEIDIDPVGTDIDDAFDESFDSVNSDELDSEIGAMDGE